MYYTKQDLYILPIGYSYRFFFYYFFKIDFLNYVFLITISPKYHKYTINIPKIPQIYHKNGTVLLLCQSLLLFCQSFGTKW